MGAWYESRYTGLFSRFGRIPPRPHDPAVAIWSGTVPPWNPSGGTELAVGGAGWTAEQAEGACVGEAVERLRSYPLPCDRAVEASYARWRLDEPAVDPARWVLFHREQYALAGFPFRPFTEATECRWVCFRRTRTGEPWWVPEELAYLSPRPGERHLICPGVSTGMSCGRETNAVVLRGLQEAIERDAVMGAWWGGYALEEWGPDEVTSVIGPSVPRRVFRPNLRYRFYRIATPLSAHATAVTVEGEDREGFCFAAASACRETRAGSWTKAILEAVQGRHYVRYLLSELDLERPAPPEAPADFSDHALFYSVHTEQLAGTVLHRPANSREKVDWRRHEGLEELVERLGPERPALFRNMTPPGIAREIGDWHVVKVLVPGLQPLHGNHRLAHLGGELWAPRGLNAWAEMMPHPFP
jgi:ribosomal protein S12 methylthiotransferase accessory factor